MTRSSDSATQALNQRICQKYGWCCQFGKTNDRGTWYVDVIVGMHDRRRFTCNDATRQGKETVSKLALDGLHDRIQIEEFKQVKELNDVFDSAIEMLDSSKRSTWERFWHDSPSVVGIDVEGNQISPPVMIQIATADYVILEVPTGTNRTLSSNLRRLLDEHTITKVFCDNFSHRDKVSLGILPPLPSSSSLSKRGCENLSNIHKMFLESPIIDIECMMLELYGPVKVPRGLARIISLCVPELIYRHIRVEKPKPTKGRYSCVGRFAMIEQGKAAPLRGLQDLSTAEQHYAALDALCTLKAYQSIVWLVASLKPERRDLLAM